MTTEFLDSHEFKLKSMCSDSDIDYYEYLSFISMIMFHHMQDLAKLDVIDNLNFGNLQEVKYALNSASVGNKRSALISVNEDINKSRKKCFDWLDNTKEPYKFILTPVYEQNTLRYSKTQCYWTGTNAIDVAFDYARYKLNKVEL